MHSTERLIRKLQITTQLDAEDLRALERLPIHVKEVAAHTAIVRESERPAQCCLLVDGFICRSKTTDRGKRQILSIHISGDIPDLQSLHLHVMDHDVTALSDCTLAFISHEPLRALTRSRPLIAEALWRDTLIDSAIFREWIVNVGRRSASERLAHFILEMRRRLATVGLAADGHFELPMTQLDVADALGLTPVHVNRVMKALRTKGLMDFRKHVVSLEDAEGLLQLGDFDD